MPESEVPASAQLWLSDQGSEEPPRLICALSTRGLESQVLRLHLNSQRVRLVVVGTATLHLSGCLERQPEEEEESSDDDAWGGDSDSSVELSSGEESSGDDGGGGGSGTAALLGGALGDDDDDDDEDFGPGGAAGTAALLGSVGSDEDDAEDEDDDEIRRWQQLREEHAQSMDDIDLEDD